MNFYGRELELSKLSKFLNQDGFSCGIILGRRRIGKSELIKQAIQLNKVDSVYYECKKISEKNNVESLSSVVSDALGLPNFTFTNIENLLEYIFKLGKEKKITLILDEYPYLRENIAGIDSILQSLIDKYHDTSNFKLILLGSFVEIMNSLLEHSNPLYGRIDLTIDLKQLNYLETSLFYPNFSNEDKVRLYSVFGGIPYYSRLIDQNKSVKQNIIDLIASKGARLENEVEMYLTSEISKIPNANQTFDALAKGYSRYTDILSQSHVSSGPTLVDVLEKLIKMEVVSKSSPINKEKNKKKISYRICDNLSLFYYKYIFRYSSQLSVMNEDKFFEKFIQEDFEKNYVPHQFEDICKQYLIIKNKKNEIDPPFYKIGKYYYDNPKNKTNGEFDIVMEDENGYVFAEVKFQEKPLKENAIKEEIDQVKKTNMKCYKYLFFSRSGFACKEKENIKFITLDDIYNTNN